MAVLLTTVSTVTINDLGGRTYTHPLINYDLTSEYTYQELRGSADLGAELDAGNVTITNNGVTVTNSADLKKLQPEPDPSGGGGGLTFADVWAVNTLINC